MTGPKRVTEKQLAANRANAQRSTGPRTPKGKAVSRYNAHTHHVLAVEDAIRSAPAIDTAVTFARYETALQNHLDRALTRLERLQRRRAGEPVPPPLRLDVTGLEVQSDRS